MFYEYSRLEYKIHISRNSFLNFADLEMLGQEWETDTAIFKKKGQKLNILEYDGNERYHIRCTALLPPFFPKVEAIILIGDYLFMIQSTDARYVLTVLATCGRALSYWRITLSCLSWYCGRISFNARLKRINCVCHWSPMMVSLGFNNS